ncbi:mammalian cell entry protein [Williamsia sp. 1138]|uniref:MlaD family protein n=1 Tax=Williamsia sp. 1138 TaxID=1903117 RepID=UPI000A106351|nr:MCE family protein [Williamsia sp. 1138]OZG28311.1 mammalian cell entry protein [Williamsia sp. 1138]
MFVDTTGRNPSTAQYALRGVVFLIVVALILVGLMLRYQGTFETKVEVTATLDDIGDGLVSQADVRYNGLIVGSVTSIDATETNLSDVNIEIVPDQAEGIPANVTARTVPSNLFGVNSIELIPPADPKGHLSNGSKVVADESKETIALQTVQNDLRELFTAVPPEQIGRVLGTIADTLRGGGNVFSAFVGTLSQYWEQINAQFPDGAPPGFDNFNDSLRGIEQSTPQLLDAMGRAVIPSITIIERQRELAGTLTAAQGMIDRIQTLFARNGDSGIQLVENLNTMTGAIAVDSEALPGALRALNNLAGKVLTVFTGVNGKPQLNIGVSFSPFVMYNRQNCPVYDGGKYGMTRGPGCSGPGTGTGPTSSGPLVVTPSSAQGDVDVIPADAPVAVTTASDNKTLKAALEREPSAADTLMLGPLVQSVRVAEGGEG